MSNIFETGELKRQATVSKMETVQKEVDRSVKRTVNLFYFIIKNHPFVDGNKRSDAHAFIWFLHQANILDLTRMTPPALMAITLLIVESNPKDKEKMVGLVCVLLAKRKKSRRVVAS